MPPGPRPGPPTGHRLPPDIDVTRPSIARVYDAMLGGRDNFEVDREVLRQMTELVPETAATAVENRRFLVRAVRWLAGAAGVDQFLDLGSGLPTAENTHQVAQRVDPDAVVVYVDNDPVVNAHGRALLEDDDRTFFCPGDLTKPDEVLADPVVTAHLDFDRPIAVLQLLTLHHYADTDEVRRIMSRYVDALASGSYVVLSHATQVVGGGPEIDEFVARYRASSPHARLRTVDEIASLFTGLELQQPGVVPVVDWWPDGPRTEPVSPVLRINAGGVARKP